MSAAGGRWRRAGGLCWLEPLWPAPAGVRAAFTSRVGGVSRGAWAGLNLAGHVGDLPAAVRGNRQRLAEALRLPAEPRWLEQVHGDRVVAGCEEGPADGAWSDRPGEVCVVMTADCLPVLLCDRAGRQVAAVHAGWRGLAGGVLEAALRRFTVAPAGLLAWLGPCIGPEAFQVGGEVRDRFIAQAAEDAACFRPDGDRWRADLAGLARRRLVRLGVGGVFGGRWCTHADPGRFYSYRRDGVTGRMAALVWLEPA